MRVYSLVLALSAAAYVAAQEVSSVRVKEAGRSRVPPDVPGPPPRLSLERRRQF